MNINIGRELGLIVGVVVCGTGLLLLLGRGRQDMSTLAGQMVGILVVYVLARAVMLAVRREGE